MISWNILSLANHIIKLIEKATDRYLVIGSVMSTTQTNSSIFGVFTSNRNLFATRARAPERN